MFPSSGRIMSFWLKLFRFLSFYSQNLVFQRKLEQGPLIDVILFRRVHRGNCVHTLKGLSRASFGNANCLNLDEMGFSQRCLSLTNQLADLNHVFNTYSMRQPDLYYFETIKMTSQV